MSPSKPKSKNKKSSTRAMKETTSMKPETSAHASAKTTIHLEKTAMKHVDTTATIESVHTSQVASPSPAPSPVPVTPAAVAPAPPVAVPGTGTTTDPTASATTVTTKLVYVKPPPVINLPDVPLTTFVPARDTRGQLPRQEELVVIPDAEAEIGRLPDYVGVFGKTVPSQAAVNQTLDSAYQWTTLRIALMAWLQYAKVQEVNAWVSSRALTARLQPAFALAVQTDPSIGEQNPSLVSLLKVRSSIAKRAASTRLANKRNEAEGKPAYAGDAGKKRKKRDEKAALANAHAASPAPAASAPVVASAPAAVGSPIAHS